VEGEFNANDDMDTFADNRSLGRSNESTQPSDEFSAGINTQYKGIFYVTMAVGIPGNCLSAIVWLRHCMTNKSSSAVYLAALAVSNVVYLLSTFLYISNTIIYKQVGLYDSARYLAMSSATVEPLLVLSFSVERLIAILRPLQVCICWMRHARMPRAGIVLAASLFLRLPAQHLENYWSEIYVSWKEYELQ